MLYVGITNSLQRRIIEHYEASLESKGFTGKYKVIYLIYFEEFDHPSDAIAREKIIKGWTRKKKEELIATKNPNWDFLNDSLIE